MSRLIRIAAIAALIVGLAIPGAAMAGVAGDVDQSALQPPLNPNFTYRCTTDGPSIRCQGTDADTWSNEDIGLTCGDQPIYATGASDEQLIRWHLADGRAVKTIADLRFDETWTLSPGGSGPSVAVAGHLTRHYDYPVPGVRSERVLTEIGLSWRVTAPGVGLIAHDAGSVRYLPGSEFDEADDLKGPKDSWDDFDGAIAEACDVLMG